MTATAMGTSRASKSRSRPGYLASTSVLGHGHQPPSTTSSQRNGPTGRLLFHAIGCQVDGGPGLSPGTCRKCSDDILAQYYRSLMRLDRRDRTQ